MANISSHGSLETERRGKEMIGGNRAEDPGVQISVRLTTIRRAECSEASRQLRQVTTWRFGVF
jgi:hypothetical protein